MRCCQVELYTIKINVLKVSKYSIFTCYILINFVYSTNKHYTFWNMFYTKIHFPLTIWQRCLKFSIADDAKQETGQVTQTVTNYGK